VIAVVGAIYNIRSLWVVSGVLIAAHIASRVLPGYVFSQLRMRVEHPLRLFHGERAELSVELTNPTPLPVPYVSLTYSVPFDLMPRSFRWATALAAGESRRVTFDLSGTRRGIYQLGPTVFSGGDVFGWHPIQRSIGSRQRVVVYPRIVALKKLGLPARAPFPDLATRLPLFEDPYRTTGVRSYVPGDSTRHVHWPATARLGAMQVRKYQHGWSRETMVLLDLSRAGMGGLRHAPIELAVTTAASVLYQIIAREKLAAGLRTQEITIGPSAGQAHLMAMLEVLAAVGPASRRDPLTESVGLPFGSTLLLVTGTIDEVWRATLEQWRRRGWRPAVVVVGEPGLAVPGIPWRRVRVDRELAEALA
jgi:uncharacterized protein (DUF58 family)